LPKRALFTARTSTRGRIPLAILERGTKKGTKTMKESQDDAFEDGPIQPDGSWKPKGGTELYFHSHLSEPDNGLESDGLEDEIDPVYLTVASEIFRTKRELRGVDSTSKERDRRVEELLRLVHSLPKDGLSGEKVSWRAEQTRTSN
jgi:hypothetical protein